MIPIGHIPSLTYLCSCTAYKFSTLGLSLSLSLSLSLTDYPRHPRQLFLHKYTEKGKMDANRRTQKPKRTETDTPKSQNRRKRTGTHIKTDANAMYGCGPFRS